ncbi:myxosortase-dependent M36 family metallopeptidase [Myxococcus landrumensis]|uniref:Myxosortase-dependent M36 family metallopeptidase n=1 Tax=Myxococcus landrumensis TaxID=2813577 RepID=A0ABX7NDA6_9BACT|nr:myxosortase-dependent M36 family metallopeptidase [Myxococcus landrumus]QSQ15391.1 myxosortase-dependent M36 family metallopeptidase [Myxococcus landrumus]
MRRLVAKLSGMALVLSGTGSMARTLPNYDAYLEAMPTARTSLSRLKPQDADTQVGVTHRDALTGAPRFVWAQGKGGGDSQAKLRPQYAGMAPATAALTQLNDYSDLYGVPSFEAAGARVSAVRELSQGVKVVTVAQEVAGIEVFRHNLKLLMNKANEVVTISGSLSPHVASATASEKLRFTLPATSAIALAYEDLTGKSLDGSLLTGVKRAKKDGRYSHFDLAMYARPLEEGLVAPARSKQIYYVLRDALIPAYYLELETGREDSVESDTYSYVISAQDGRVLSRKNLREDAAFSYRVFADATSPFTPHDGPAGTNATPHPDGTPTVFFPAFVAPSLVTLQNAPFSQNDPWLSAGATVTSGNNVDAYADLATPNGYGAGDLRPTVTAPGVFDRTMQFDIAPNANAEQIAAATTSLFFVNNWLHDWFYDSGFDELAGNAQVDNYGRGGEGGDPVIAQAQDYGGVNNANMSTPADGASPQMQMYLFNGVRHAVLTVNAPATVAGDIAPGVAYQLGPQTFDTTGDVVIAQDPANPAGPLSTDACSPLTNAAEVNGKIAFVDVGTCTQLVKITNAQAAGAAGVLFASDVSDYRANISGTSAAITIPSMRVTRAEGNRIRNAEGLNVRMFREPTLQQDGTIDNIIVAHEWGHYMSNRLIQDAAGLVNNQGRAMGEGWADFTALLMVTRPEDIQVPSNANWNGAYGAAEYATRGNSPASAFFGIRRVTYSSDMAKNALTFRHIADSSALPTTAPTIPGSPNSQVHNSGEVWATMLWEVYTSLLRAHPFEEAQARMKRYLTLGYMQTPYAPTYLEARDAILAGAYVNDPEDAQRIWAAFAKRGAGVDAVAPPSSSRNHEGVVESFRLGASLRMVSAILADDLPTGSCDRDGVLDNGETGRIIITMTNIGSASARDASATVTSRTRGVSIGNGGAVRFPEIPPFGEVTVAIPVSLSGAAPSTTAEFILAFRDEHQATPGDVIETLYAMTNQDEAPGTTKVETVQSNIATIPWEFESSEDPRLNEWYFGYAYVDDDKLNRGFHGRDVAVPSDFWLKTPPLQVSATEPFVLSFEHAYQFETNQSNLRHYDGAVIEITQDEGATWTDIGTPLYGGVLYSVPEGTNPLKGRNALVNVSPNFPTLMPATLDLGTTYAGQTVQIRFRIGTDDGTSAEGWTLDNLSFRGIDNTPFTGFVADNNVCVNRPPVANAGPDLTVDERTPVTVAGSGTDADGNTLTYTWTQTTGPAVALAGTDTPTVTFTAPDVPADRDIVLRLRVSDGTLATTDTVTVRVRNVNRAPTVNAGVDASVNERSAVTLSGSASDVDGDGLTYLWTQVSGTPVALAGYTAASATFTAPEVTFDTTLTFRLAVSDGKVSVSDTVDVIVLHVNRPPVVTASSVSVDERSTASLLATASDADGDALTYSWSQVSGSPVTLVNADTATASFATGEVATNTVLGFRVTVSDGTAEASHDVTVDVRHVNRAPTVNAGLDGSVNERAQATLSGSASDADGDSLTYTWVQIAGTPVAISNATSAVATFVAPETVTGETLTFRLSVSDGSALASDTVDVQVSPVNRAPVVTASSASANERSTASITATGADPDGDSLTYSWERISGPQVTLENANTATVSFATGEVTADTVITLRVTVTDGTATASHDVAVTVLNVNRAPTVGAGADGSVGARGQYTLAGTANDADGDSLTYAWVQTSGTPVALAGATSLNASFTAPDGSGTLTFRLLVSDGVHSVSDSVDVVVAGDNRVPVVTASAVTADERTTVSLVAQATDPDGDALTYTWIQVHGDPVTLENANTATASFRAGEVSANAELTFRVTVSDGTNNVSKEVTVTLRNVNRAPVANAGVAATVQSGATVTLNGSASSDPDGTAVTYQWTQVSGPTVALSSATVAQPTFTAPSVSAERDLVFSLVVSDGAVSSAASLVVLTVTSAPVPNREPVAQARIIVNGDQTSMTLDGSASSDADGDALTYKWEQTGGPRVTLNEANKAVISVDVPDLDGGSATFTFKLTVTDSKNASHSATAQATASPAEEGGCSSTGSGAPMGMMALALLSLLHRRRRSN